MTKSFLLAPLAGLLLAGCVTDSQWSEAPGSVGSVPAGWWGRDVGSVELFYDPLSPYGRWEADPRYGRVFWPSGVGAGWQPYLNGYWTSDPRYGRRWVSGDRFGWATSHYGRWAHHPARGWFWVPDTRFGPAWVDWRDEGGRVGWAPMPPIGWQRYATGRDWWLYAPRGRQWDRDWNDHRGRPGGWQRPDRDRPDRDHPVVDRGQPGGQPVRPRPDGVHPRSAVRGETGERAWRAPAAVERPAERPVERATERAVERRAEQPRAERGYPGRPAMREPVRPRHEP